MCYAVPLLSFPACTRDVTLGKRGQPRPRAFISRLHARCNGQAMTCQYRQRLYAFCANLISDNQPTAIFLGHCRCLIQVRASPVQLLFYKNTICRASKRKRMGKSAPKVQKNRDFQGSEYKKFSPFPLLVHHDPIISLWMSAYMPMTNRHPRRASPV